MSRPAKPADVRFYFDADVLGVAKVLAQLRPDITYPGDPGAVVHKRQRPPCPIASPSALDTEWIPMVAEAGWLIITRDSHIQDHRAQVGEGEVGRLLAGEGPRQWRAAGAGDRRGWRCRV